MQSLYNYWHRVREALNDPVNREGGFTTAEWAFILAGVVTLAVVVIAVVNSVVNTEIAKLPGQ